MDRTRFRSSRWSVIDRDAALPRLNTLAFILLTLFLAAAPFPYGAVTPLGTFVLNASSFAIAALAFLSARRISRIGAAIIPITAMLLIACTGALQLIPLGMKSLETISPLAWKTYRDANEILHVFSRPPITPKISISPWDTEVTILLTLAYTALFAAAALLCSTRSRRRIAAGALLASATIHLLYSTATTGGNDRLHGAFINTNHFAGYLEIALAVAFALVWRELLHSRERAAGVRDLAERFERRALPLVGPIVLWAVIAAGIGLTRSRGGILAAILMTIVLLLIAPLHRRGARRPGIAAAAVLAVCAGLVFVAFTAGEAPLLRFLAADPQELGSNTRVDLWSASIDAWRTSPHLGSGLGAFREAFRPVQPEEIVGLVEQAHNDFLQMLVTGGWIGALLVTAAIGAMLVILLHGWIRQPHREESAFALAGIGALISLVLHGLVEFNMSIPAIPATLAIVLGLAWSAARERGDLVSV